MLYFSPEKRDSGMLRFLLRRLLLVIPALFGLLVLTFVMVRVVPADPAAALAGENATVEQIELIRQSYGFDRPLYEQFWVYFKQVVSGDFGVSVYSNVPVGRKSPCACRPPSN